MMVAIKHEQTIDQRWWFDQQIYIHTIYVYYIWILYMLDIIYSMVYSNIQIYICIHIYICWIEPKWIARWLWIYSNQHDHDFFKQTHTGYLFGISVKGSHPLEFIQHKKQQTWNFLFRCGMYSNQKRPYKDPIQHREDGHNLPASCPWKRWSPIKKLSNLQLLYYVILFCI